MLLDLCIIGMCLFTAQVVDKLVHSFMQGYKVAYCLAKHGDLSSNDSWDRLFTSKALHLMSTDKICCARPNKFCSHRTPSTSSSCTTPHRVWHHGLNGILFTYICGRAAASFNCSLLLGVTWCVLLPLLSARLYFSTSLVAACWRVRHGHKSLSCSCILPWICLCIPYTSTHKLGPIRVETIFTL
jgi:hypothetical protein